MINKKRITLVVPCKNEERIIDAFIKRIPKFIDEVLIIDNNSTDRSVKVAREAGAKVIRESRHIHGIGYGFAHIKGLECASGDYIVAMDGDDTYPLKAIPRIINAMQIRHLNFVSCNRLPLKNKKAISKLRQIGIQVLNLEVKLFYGYPIKDILSGMWIVQREIVHELKLTQGDWNFSPEIKLEAITNPRISFGEYHIDHFEREKEISKQSIFKTGFAHLIYILQRRVTIDNVLLHLFDNLDHHTSVIRTRLASIFL